MGVLCVVFYVIIVGGINGKGFIVVLFEVML